MMREITGDFRYEEMIGKIEQDGKGEITMCELLDRYEARGVQKGIEKGESLLAKLMECLFKDNRLEDAKLVVENVEERKRLYLEYDLK